MDIPVPVEKDTAPAAAEAAGRLTASARTRLALLTGAVVFAATLAAGPRLLIDPDCYLHVAVGRWILAHRQVPDHDVFSYSLTGAPWVPHEWLAGVLFAQLHDTVGWLGLAAVAAFCFAAATALLLRALLDHLEPAHALIGTALAAGLCVPHLFVRPHALSYPLLILWVWMLVAARARNRAPPLWGPLLIALWANLHASYVFGIALAALVAAEAVFEAEDRSGALRAAIRWGLFGTLALLAALATPNGIAGVMLPFELVRMDFALSLVREWQSPNFQTPQPLEPWLMLLLLGALSLGIRLPLTRIAMLLLLIGMALHHQRHAEILGLAAPLLLAPSLAPQLRRFAQAPVAERIAQAASNAGPGGAALIGVLAVALGGAALRGELAGFDGPRAPSAALAFATANHLSGPVFNDINFGDYLLFSGISPFIDGRIDMYGDALVRRYATVGEFPRLAAQYGFSWAILSPANAHVALLDNLPGWQRLYTDDRAILYRRAESAP